jgi:hypothetical protein
MLSDDRHAAFDGDARRAIMTALSHLGLEHADLWLRYFALGGNASSEDLRRWLAGLIPIADADYDLLAQALNDAFSGTEHGFPVPYADELAQGSSRRS